jgi:hypothetical protein
MRFTAALRCPGTSEDLRKTVAPVMGGPNNRGEANIYGRFKGGYIDSTIIIYGQYYLWEI